MVRTATTTDVFNPIAEPRRRAIIEVLAHQREQVVGELVERLRIAQPAVSKHLGVLRKVGLVSVNKRGQQRHYRLNSQELKTVHDWVAKFEQFLTTHLDRVKERAERKASGQSDSQELQSDKKKGSESS